MLKKDFNERCYDLLKTVPAGKVTTYAELARGLGSKASRAVGNAMRLNPHAPEVPCHRVVHSDGRLGNYQGGVAIKEKLLKEEGVNISSGRVVDFYGCLHRF